MDERIISTDSGLRYVDLVEGTIYTHQVSPYKRRE